MNTSTPTVLFLPGSRWEDVAGTDRHLATAFSRKSSVVWVDPAERPSGTRRPLRELVAVAPCLTVLRHLGPPGASRPVIRWLSAIWQERQVSTSLRRLNADVMATIALSPRSVLKPGRGTQVLYVTDDWVAGAPLMGLNKAWVERRLRDNLRRADLVVAVSVALADSLRELAQPGVEVTVIPNGTWVSPPRKAERGSHAVLIGQLNERLDLDCLEETAARGTDIVVIGPRAARDPSFVRRLDQLLDHPRVRWLGSLPHHEISRHLATAKVGLTPYADSAFNRSSFPLKTLEYLGAGLPVVTTDLPAARQLGTDLVSVVGSATHFADRVADQIRWPWDASREAQRRDFAAQHSWEVRADQLRRLISSRT